jgi:hypothetical protein
MMFVVGNLPQSFSLQQDTQLSNEILSLIDSNSHEYSTSSLRTFSMS